MKGFSVMILRYALRTLARRTVARYRPGVIGVTGSVGKTSTKRAIAAVLSPGRNVRVSQGNLNSELGLSLAILGEWSEDEWKLVSRGTDAGTRRIRKALFWLKVIFASLLRLFAKGNNHYPDILVLEYGVDRPYDMKRLLEIATPNVSVVTAIGDIPVHVEFFGGPDEVAREKGRLIESLPAEGFAILNFDDETVLELKSRTRAHLMTFGFGKGAEVQIKNFENVVEGGEPIGAGFKIQHGSVSASARLDGAFGKIQAYAGAAAACVGLIFGLSVQKIAENLKNYTPAMHRLGLLAGVKDTRILDDSYNASPLSMHAALDTLRDLPGKRKIAVLGDMLEIGKYAIEAHEAVGRLASGIADMLITVGPRAKFIAEGAKEKGMSGKSIASFDRAEDAQKPVQDILKKGDLVLVKGSHAMQLEKVVEEIRSEIE